MMNGRGKSDSAIVAERPTNKAGRPAEEPEEPRAETEENAVQQSTRRAQNRESVSQALDRIRQAARQRKKEKFTALLHHISPEHLEGAFFELKENAAPGVDGLTKRARKRERLEDPLSLPPSQRRQHPGYESLRGSMAGLCAPLPTLRCRPRGRQRTARGRCRSLLLHRIGLAPTTHCRSPGALRKSLDTTGAIKWTRLSCRTFAANAVRLQLHALAYNLGNFLRTLATPEPIKDWSLASLKEKLIKIGA